MKHIIAIDPGVTGAVCWMNVKDPAGIILWDLPVMDVGTKGKRMVLDVATTAQFLREMTSLPETVVILEDQTIGAAMPRWKKKGSPAAEDGAGDDGQTTQSISTIGRQQRLSGQLEGILATLGASYEIVNPQVWKRHMMPGQARNKEAARQAANRMFPRAAADLKRKKDHNRAEAALLAEWRRRRG
jgi:hypothetical protein